MLRVLMNASGDADERGAATALRGAAVLAPQHDGR
jgi:hypothetical protein